MQSSPYYLLQNIFLFIISKRRIWSFVKESIHKNFTKPKEIKSYGKIKYGKRQCTLK